jgi:UDP-glucuronate 4-epimerase
MYVVVSGVAGFIGSHLAEALIAEGHRVAGIDCFTDYYDVARKRENVGRLAGQAGFELIAADLGEMMLEPVLQGAGAVFHLAAQPGARDSFGAGFATYCARNVLATQHLLEAAKNVRTPKLVYASSSSVYGNAPSYPTSERNLPKPLSPYGMTKLAAEHLCALYGRNWGLPTISLRYFSVYGPRQRPDMAIQKMIESTVAGRPFPLYGDGLQVRDFTYVADVVRANLAAAAADTEPGTVVNIAGGSRVTIREVAEMTGSALGRHVIFEHLPAQPGDVQQTGGDRSLAQNLLGWQPEVDLAEGLTQQVQAVMCATDGSSDY